uniref:Uncharacterized protein n=1 Tax=Picea glauca TaxID=3330 RepID=A0A124GNK0_PICGL|nr:hypothetical protein ABT39_MTgene4408 [Picea glauca]QHR86233.1 hypothetical protein Q903MT_gene232 [Picea sitchensis]
MLLGPLLLQDLLLDMELYIPYIDALKGNLLHWLSRSV